MFEKRLQLRQLILLERNLESLEDIRQVIMTPEEILKEHRRIARNHLYYEYIF